MPHIRRLRSSGGGALALILLNRLTGVFLQMLTTPSQLADRSLGLLPGDPAQESSSLTRAFP
jgi:hypothetical protein